ncbi:MAG: glycosyltransferase, partial [Candidatus Binatia bacterium]
VSRLPAERVGGVGRLSAEKGFHRLIEAVALAREHGCSLGLVLAGDGPQRSQLETRARELSCNGHVKFLGLRRDPRPVYAGLDVFALPSLEEGSPNALLEAMACGRAVVATRVGGVPEIVAEECSGLLVVPNSARALADSLMRLAADPPLRQRLAQGAARRARDHFDITRTVERYADLYRELLRAPMHAAAGPQF